jgi:hypothetical protein
MIDAYPELNGSPSGPCPVACQKRIALIILWRGLFPSYFPLFLASCEGNPEFTWLFLTEQPAPADLPPNVHFLPVTAAEVNQRIGDVLGVRTTITRPYKYIDLRPMYGVLFADHLRGFTHWGHGDIDVILGRLRDFLTDDLFDRFPRVQTSGHLSIYRNNDEVNHYYTLEAPGVPTWRNVLANPDHFFVFDEWPGINRILDYHRIPTYHGAPIADIDALSPRMTVFNEPNRRVQAFYWHDGRIVQQFEGDASGWGESRDFAYLHLRKRRMPAPPFDEIPPLGYFITPQGFVPRESEACDAATLRRMNRPSLEHVMFLLRWRTGNLWRKLTGRSRPPPLREPPA